MVVMRITFEAAKLGRSSDSQVLTIKIGAIQNYLAPKLMFYDLSWLNKYNDQPSVGGTWRGGCWHQARLLSQLLCAAEKYSSHTRAKASRRGDAMEWGCCGPGFHQFVTCEHVGAYYMGILYENIIDFSPIAIAWGCKL